MQRDIIGKLNAWKASEYRKPLILKGGAPGWKDVGA